jgi:hypothetical protein
MFAGEKLSVDTIYQLSIDGIFLLCYTLGRYQQTGG